MPFPYDIACGMLVSRETAPAIDSRSILSETEHMRGNELIKRVQKYAKINGLPCEWHPERGKGSHGSLTLGERFTVVRNPKDELKTGTLHAMLKQLNLKLSDI